MLIRRTASPTWEESSIASQKLGLSENTLNSWRDCGYLESEKHWKYFFNGSRRAIMYNLEQCSLEITSWWGTDTLKNN